MFLSNVKVYIKSTISSTQWVWTTFKISEDFESGEHIESTSPLSFVVKTQTQIERMTITATGGTATIIQRWLDKSDAKVADVLLQRQWNDWTIGYVTAFASDLLDIDKTWDTIEINSDVDFTWAVWFNGGTLKLPTFADTTARDVVYTSPVNWDKCFLVWVWEQVYNWGAWVTLDEWTPTPNASDTVAGKVEIATLAQSKAWTDTGETGATLSVKPSDIAKNTQSNTFNYGTDAWWDDTYVVVLTPILTAYTAGQRLTFTPTTANTWACSVDFWPWVINIKTKDGNDPQNWVIRANVPTTWTYDGTNFILDNEDLWTKTNPWVLELWTPLEVVTGTDDTRTLSVKDAYEMYNNIFYGTTNTAYDSWSLWNIDNSFINAGSYATAKSVTASHSWRFTISANMTVESWNLNQASARIYLNWVLVEQKDWTYINGWAFNTTFTNFIITKWDVIRLDVKVIQSQFPWNNERVNVSTFNFKYNTIVNQTFFS